jgi:hypothetical protein
MAMVAAFHGMMQRTERTIDDFPFMTISNPRAHSSAKAVMWEISFGGPTRTENGKARPSTPLLVIPLPLANVCHPTAPVEAQKSKSSNKVRHA